MAWFAELLRKEPEARSIIVAMTVTLVYVGHATIPLGAWRVADAPQYPVGFPMATVMSAVTVFTLTGLLWWTKKHPKIAERGYSGLSVPEEATDGGTKDAEVGKGTPDDTSALK
jgi:ACS family pantothenate transporter-like MFS transporter